MSDSRSDLNKMLTLIAGNDRERRARMLKRFSGFTTEAGKEISASGVSRMSERWAEKTVEKTVDKIVQALADGEVHACYNEKGEKIQYGLFD